MQTFKDKDGRQWTIELTIGTVERVRDVSGGKFNLYEPAWGLGGKRDPGPGESLHEVLWSDYSTFWELLWLLCEPEAEPERIDAKDFGKAMAARCLVDAQEAFHREWHDFFLQLRKSENAAVVEKMSDLHAKAVRLVETKLRDPRIAQLATEAEKAMEAAATRGLETALTNGFGTLQALSESTPDH